MSTIQCSNEADLLCQINQDLPSNVRRRYNELIDKGQDFSLTEPEYTELLKLTDQEEQMQAQRIVALAALANLRQVSLSDLMISLGIP